MSTEEELNEIADIIWNEDLHDYTNRSFGDALNELTKHMEHGETMMYFSNPNNPPPAGSHPTPSKLPRATTKIPDVASPDDNLTIREAMIYALMWALEPREKASWEIRDAIRRLESGGRL